MGKFEKARPRQKKPIPTSTWNNLVQNSIMRSGSGKLAGADKLLAGSTVVPATTNPGVNIPPWTPVHVIKQRNHGSLMLNQPIYEIREISQIDNQYYDYGFTTGDGIVDGNGYIVISGIAICRVKRKWLWDDAVSGDTNNEISDVWLNIPDGSITVNAVTVTEANYDLLNWVGPVGRFKIIGQEPISRGLRATAQVTNPNDWVYLAVDMASQPGKVVVRLAEPATSGGHTPNDIRTVGGAGSAVSGASLRLQEAFVARKTADSDSNLETIGEDEDDSTFKIYVGNPYQNISPPGMHTATWSPEWKRFLLDPWPHRLYEGVTLAGISSGSTGGSVQLREVAGTTVTPFNVTATLSTIFGTSATVSPGTEILAMNTGKGYVIIGAECAADPEPASKILVDPDNTGTPSIDSSTSTYDAIIQSDGTYLPDGAGSWSVQELGAPGA